MPACKRASASSAVEPLARKRILTCDGAGAWLPGEVVLQVAAKLFVCSVFDDVVGTEMGFVEAVVVAGDVDDDAGVSVSGVAACTVDVDAVVLASALDAAALDPSQSSAKEEPSCITAAENCGHWLKGNGTTQQCGGRVP